MAYKTEHKPYPHADGHRAKVGYPASDGDGQHAHAKHEKALEHVQHLHDHPAPPKHGAGKMKGAK